MFRSVYEKCLSKTSFRNKIVFVLIITSFLNPCFCKTRNKRIEIKKQGIQNYCMVGPFEFFSTLKRSKMRKIARYIQAFHQESDKIYGKVKSFKKQPQIYLFEEKREYILFVKKNNQGHGKYAGGFYSPSKNWIVLFFSGSIDSTLKTMFHEMGHLYTMNTFKPLCQALNEGISVYLEASDFSFSRFKFGDIHKNYWKLSRQKPCRSFHELNQFFKLRGYQQMQIKETFGASQYARAWSLIFYCIHGNPKTSQFFGSYLQSLKTQADPRGQRLLKTLKQNDPNFIKSWNDFINNPRLPKKVRAKKGFSLI